MLHNLYAMNKFMPYIMPERSDGCNTYADEFDVTETDAFCKQMIAQGLENFSFLHVMLAAYVRTLSQKPAINRFIAGQRIYARNNIRDRYGHQEGNDFRVAGHLHQGGV